MPEQRREHDEQQRLAEHAAVERSPKPAVCASAAPAKPPISACDDDDGRPHHQVSRFQTIAPISAAQDHVRASTTSGATPLAIAAGDVHRRRPGTRRS